MGLLVGGMGLLNAMPEVIAAPSTRSVGAVAVAGLLVGIGTRMGNGCTSGHGVCGLTRRWAVPGGDPRLHGHRLRDRQPDPGGHGGAL